MCVCSLVGVIAFVLRVSLSSFLCACDFKLVQQALILVMSVSIFAYLYAILSCTDMYMYRRYVMHAGLYFY